MGKKSSPWHRACSCGQRSPAQVHTREYGLGASGTDSIARLQSSPLHQLSLGHRCLWLSLGWWLNAGFARGETLAQEWEGMPKGGCVWDPGVRGLRGRENPARDKETILLCAVPHCPPLHWVLPNFSCSSYCFTIFSPFLFPATFYCLWHCQ